MQSAEHAWTPGVGSLGLALIAPLALLPPTLADGGVAPLAVSAVVALFVGAPAAVALWWIRPEWPRSASAPVVAITEGLADLVALGAIAATAAPWIRSAGSPGWAMAAGGWLLAWGLSRRASTAGFPAALAVLLAVFLGARGALADLGSMTLLQPQWLSAPRWIGPALLAGVWMGGLGAAEWTVGPRRRPGERRAPVAGAGAALLLLVGLAAPRWATLRGHPGISGVRPSVRDRGHPGGDRSRCDRAADAPAGRCGGASSWGSGSPCGPPGRRRGAIGFGWSIALPLGMAILIGLGAARLSGAGQGTAGIAGVAVLAAVGLGAPGLPGSMIDAAAAAATVAVVFWLVATRAVLAWRTA